MPTTLLGNELDVLHRHRASIGATYTGPASYATGGDPFVAADVKLGRGDFFLFGIARDAAGTIYLLDYDYTAEAVLWYDLAGAEIAATTDLSGFTARVLVVGS